jgi:hypothetical protein
MYHHWVDSTGIKVINRGQWKKERERESEMVGRRFENPYSSRCEK